MGLQLNGSGGDLGIVSFLVPMLYYALNRNTVFLHQAVQQRRIPHHYLQHAIHIPQVNERYSAVITDILHPSGHTKLRSHILFRNLIQCPHSVLVFHNHHLLK